MFARFRPILSGLLSDFGGSNRRRYRYDRPVKYARQPQNYVWDFILKHPRVNIQLKTRGHF